MIQELAQVQKYFEKHCAWFRKLEKDIVDIQQILMTTDSPWWNAATQTGKKKGKK